MALDSSDLDSILQAGVLAPSADNHHRFELAVTSAGLLLYGSEAYLKAEFHHKFLCLVSFGAVIENMRIRAARLGYRTTLNCVADPNRPALIAELNLTRCSATPSAAVAIEAAISERHTNRRLMLGGPCLDDATLARIQREVEEVTGAAIAFCNSADQRARLSRLVGIAETERFNTPALHHDLFSAVRFDVGWHASAHEGLPPAALCIEPGLRWAFAQLRRPRLMAALTRIGVHHLLGFRAGTVPCRAAAHLGIVTTSLPGERGVIAGGMALERVWLAAETMGLAFQPFAGPALLARPEYAEVPAATGRRLRDGWKTLTSEVPIMAFRMGHARRPVIRSGRCDPGAYIRN